MRVYVDYDDILCETARACSRILFEAFGKRVAFERIASFDLGESFGLNADDLEHLMALMHEPDALMQLEPLPGAAQILRAWQQRGYEIDIVTGRPVSTDGPSREWLAMHAIPYASITFVDKYHRSQADCPGVPLLSLEALAQRDYCMAIDDAPKMIRYLCEQMPMPVIVLDRPWNAALVNTRAIRCTDWSQIERRFDEELTGRVGSQGPPATAGRV